MLLEKELNELEACIPHLDRKNEKVTGVSVGWQVLHALKVARSIIAALHKSNPDKFEDKFNKYWLYIVLFNSIPRGRGKAPKFVKPAEEEIKAEEVERLLAEIRTEIDSLDQLPPNAYFKHYFFGMLNVKKAKRFIRVHTRHHLKIIREILED